MAVGWVHGEAATTAARTAMPLGGQQASFGSSLVTQDYFGSCMQFIYNFPSKGHGLPLLPFNNSS